MDYANSPFEIKQLAESGQIEGLLSGFGNVDSYGDIVLKGAFTKSLATRSRPLPMLLQHDPMRPIGAWTDWQERSDGLYVKGAIVLETQDGREAQALAKAGALTGLSIGYREVKAIKNPRANVRELVELDLKEGSLVTFPANPRTHVASVKAIGGPADIEGLLRETGLSGRQAKAAASAAWKAIDQSNSDDEAVARLAALIAESTNRIARI